MAIYKTPYDTTAGQAYRYAHIVQELKAALTGQGLAVHAVHDGEGDAHAMAAHLPHGAFSEHFKLALVQGGNSFADNIGFFKHPVALRHDDTDYIALDIRTVGKWDAVQQQFNPRNRPEYVWSLKRAILTGRWLAGRHAAVRDLSNVPAQVYGAFVSESLARRFALDAAEQATISVLACYFYYGLFEESNEVDEDQKNNLAGKIARLTHVEATRVFQIIDTLGALQDVEALCNAIRDTVQNHALENLNPGFFFEQIGRAWLGANGNEVLCASMEHPPTWVMIVASSMASDTYKRTVLAKISTRYDKANAGQALEQSLSRLLGGPQAVDGLDAYSAYFGDA